MITLNTVYSNLQCPVKGGLPVIYESNGRNHLLLFPQIPDIMTDRNAEPAVASTCRAPLATPELSTQCTSVLSDDRQIEIEAFFDIVSMSTCTEACIFWGILCRAKVNISICCSRLLNHSRKTTFSWENLTGFIKRFKFFISSASNRLSAGSHRIPINSMDEISFIV